MRSKRPAPEGASDGGDRSDLHELRSFGRRRGRKLSARQQHLLETTLPRLAVGPQPGGGACPSHPKELFPAGVERVWLEIGFGGGEHLLWQARANAAAGLIGCEVFEDGVVKALSSIEDSGLANVRLCSEDARALLRWLPSGSIARAFILFPDPWPKKRHIKRRLINRGLVDELARVMEPDGELRIATDIGDYLRTILLAFRGYPGFVWTAAGPSDWRQRTPDWPPTRYEAKAEREGRRRYYLRFRRAGGS